MFGGVRNKLTDNVSQRYSDRGRHFHRNPFNCKIPMPARKNPLQIVADVLKITLELDTSDVIKSVKALMYAGYCGDAICSDLQLIGCL
ncbi:hypothetical protein ABIF68_009342 [Bradyrhizobium japonicum]